MPWQEKSSMSLRLEFVCLAQAGEMSFSELCRRFEISRKTGYKLLVRFEREAGLSPRSRQPHDSPLRTCDSVQRQVLALRDQHPAWGGRKLKRRLEDLGQSGLPNPSTITQILRRNGRLLEAGTQTHPGPFKRFEHEAPNHLWQMDFKGHFPLGDGSRCQPLTVLDDHSRYSLVLSACVDQQRQTVQARLTEAFRRYGLPERMTMDNGAPWGCDGNDSGLTRLTAWLMRLGIRVSHSRPYHPQTQGKDERFHRTLDNEVIQRWALRDQLDAQARFDAWRAAYNLERPHDALGLATPSTRYRPSLRGFPEVLPPIAYWPGDEVRKVGAGGCIHFRGKRFKVGKALIGQPVGLRPGEQEPSTYERYSRRPSGVTYVSKHLLPMSPAQTPPPEGEGALVFGFPRAPAAVQCGARA